MAVPTTLFTEEFTTFPEFVLPIPTSAEKPCWRTLISKSVSNVSYGLILSSVIFSFALKNEKNSAYPVARPTLLVLLTWDFCSKYVLPFTTTRISSLSWYWLLRGFSAAWVVCTRYLEKFLPATAAAIVLSALKSLDSLLTNRELISSWTRTLFVLFRIKSESLVDLSSTNLETLSAESTSLDWSNP